MLSIIAAISDNNAIGKDNKLLWHMPGDLRRFKKLTTGHTMIMGRKTFESLGKILPNRKHVVLTRDMNYNIENSSVEIIHDISEVEKYINSDEETFVIGGAIVYRQLLDKVNKLYITKIHEKFEGDAYFPVINEEDWRITEAAEYEKDEENPYNYEFLTYERI